MKTRRIVGLLLAGFTIVLAFQPLRAEGQPSPLRIVVIAGEDAVNVIQQKTAVVPLVEVRDRNNVPVAGAVVTFSITGGKGAAFGGASTLTVTTNAAGQAAAAGFSPLAAGTVQINVQAAFQGQLAAATIAQTNVMTVAQAAAAATGSSSATSSGAAGSAGGSGGGGISGLAIGGIAAGVAGAGALVAVTAGGKPEPPPVPPNNAPTAANVAASPSTVLLSADPVAFSAQVSDPENDPLTFRWEFGDGNTSTEIAPRHTYAAAGTFTVRLSVSDGKSTTTGQTTVTVFSLSGTWRSDPVQSGFGTVQLIMILSQAGGTVTGTTPVVTGTTGSGGPGTVQGSIRAASPRIAMTWVFNNDGTPGRTNTYQMSLDTDGDPNTLTGNAGGLPTVFRRQ